MGIHRDVSQHGFGRYNPSTDQGWRYKLSQTMSKHFQINVLEFITTLIGVWLEIIPFTIDYARILCMTDNNNAVGWPHKT